MSSGQCRPDADTVLAQLLCHVPTGRAPGVSGLLFGRVIQPPEKPTLAATPSSDFFCFFFLFFFFLFFSLHSFCLLIIVFAKWEMNESIFSLLAWLCCPVWLLVYGFCFTCRPVVSLTSKYGSDVQVFSPLCLKCCSYFSCQTRKTRYCPSNFCHINIGFFRKK